MEKLEHGLALVPRVKLLLAFERLSKESRKPVDEWHLKEWVRAQVKKCFKLDIGDKDLVQNRKLQVDAAACWELLLWNLEAEDVKRRLLPVLEGVQLNVGGVRLKCSVKQSGPESFEEFQASWETETVRPDTLVIKGLPSRWFAELRVSTQASPLVTHTIFSKFGKIKNLELVADDDAGLQCNIWIQFDQHSGFCNAAQALCGRSMGKEGSTLKAHYVVEWDNSDYFNPSNVRKRRFERERAQKLAEDERTAQARREQAKKAEEQRLMELTQALREKEEREEAERLRQLQLAEEQNRLLEERLRREEEARKKAEEEERERQIQEAEERRRQEEEAALKRAEVERKNEEIREAMRKLLQEQEEQKQEEDNRRRKQAETLEKERRKKQAEEAEEKRRAARMEQENAERWQLYSKEGEPWQPSSQLQFNGVKQRLGLRSKRLRSVIVGQSET